MNKEIVKVESVDPKEVDIVAEVGKENNNLYYVDHSAIHACLELTNIKYISVKEFVRLKELGIPLLRIVEESKN